MSTRLQVLLDDSAFKEVKFYQGLGPLGTTLKDVFNSAFTLFKWAVVERAKGFSIAAISADGRVIKELSMPFLEDAARNLRERTEGGKGLRDPDEESTWEEQDEDLVATPTTVEYKTRKN